MLVFSPCLFPGGHISEPINQWPLNGLGCGSMICFSGINQELKNNNGTEPINKRNPPKPVCSSGTNSASVTDPLLQPITHIYANYFPESSSSRKESVLSLCLFLSIFLSLSFCLSLPLTLSHSLLFLSVFSFSLSFCLSL